MADSAPVMIWVSGLDKGCFWFNKVWLEFRGKTIQEEYGFEWSNGVHPGKNSSVCITQSYLLYCCNFSGCTTKARTLDSRIFYVTLTNKSRSTLL
jgi:hypothetical protein